MKKSLSALLALVLLFSSAVPALAAETPQTDIEILNPYADVDWARADTYKACLHCHTNASDGACALADWLQLYYDAGYDILAVTDHGVVNHGWNRPVRTNGIFNGFRTVQPLSSADYTRITTGSDRGGRGMTDITGTVECNMAVVSKTHVNGYWTTYGQGVWGKENDYASAPRAIEKAGGYSVLNHVGDWVNSNNYPARAKNPFYIRYFADIFTECRTCLGMEIVNNTDNCTRADRILWDELLQVVIPTGRNIWAFSDDDSEQPQEIGRSFELFPMQENTEENVKKAMIDGAFFAASKYQKNPARQGEIEGDGLVPMVTDIRIDGGRITVQCDPDRGCDTIEWISDGKVIATDNSGTCRYTLDLNEYRGEVGCYVRFVLKSTAHGVTYSQPFELRYIGRVEKPIPASPIPDNLFGRAFWLWYQRLGTALTDFLTEKIGLALGKIPKISD